MRKFFIPLGIFISLITYILLSYFTNRSNFIQLGVLWAVLFGIYFYLLQFDFSEKQLKWLLYAGLTFRFILLFSAPNLSDDYFRFIWDGRLLVQGENPFLDKPSFYLTSTFGFENETVFKQLNSPEYFTIYPPVSQFVFWISSWVFPKNILGAVIIMKIFLFIGECISLVVLPKLLRCFQLPPKRVLLYALNPLIIVELVGNLHFEALMITFLLLFLFFLTQKKPYISSVFLGFAISVKLLPLMLFPFLIKRLGWKHTFIVGVMAMGVFLAGFIPFYTANLIPNFFSSIQLYFQTFEFNASIYYLIRWLGFQIYGYNIIAAAGSILSVIVFGLIVWFALKEKQKDLKSLLMAFLFAFSCYFFLSSIVHPWYLSGLIAFSVFSPFRYAIVWSSLAWISYFAYSNPLYLENTWMICLEYLFVFGVLSYELLFKKLD